jgi:hypothetical protein
MQRDTRPTELGDYLKHRRARLDPDALGFHTGRRRTPDYAVKRWRTWPVLVPPGTWLEQGRGGTPSAEVLERLCHALQLSPPEREHVFHLALGRAPEVRYTPSLAVTARLQKVLDCMTLSPAMIRTATWCVLAWNQPAAVVLTDYAKLPHTERNILRRIFLDPQVREVQADWEGLAQSLVAAFRADATRSGATAEVKPLIDELMAASPLFAELWRSNTIDTMGEGTKVLIHREAGRLSLEYSSFAVEGQPDLTMIVYNPSTPEDAQKSAHYLAQPPARQIKPGIAHLHCVLADMAMGDSNRQRIGGIRLRVRRKFQQGAHHMLNLAFLGAANSHYGLFDLAGRIFKHGQILVYSSHNGHTAPAQA